jgi:hypothetical protein
MHGVERDQGAGCGRLPLVLGHPRGVRPGGAGLPNPHRMGLAQEQAAQAAEDAPDHRRTEANPPASHQHLERPLAYPRGLLAQLPHRLVLGGGPGRPTRPPGTPGARFETGQVGRIGALAPPIDRRHRDLKGDGGVPDPGPRGVFHTAKAVVCLSTQGWGVRQLPLDRDRHPADDREAPAHARLVHLSLVPLAMLGHDEGISWVVMRISTIKIPGSIPSLHRRVLTCV